MSRIQQIQGSIEGGKTVALGADVVGARMLAEMKSALPLDGLLELKVRSVSAAAPGVLKISGSLDALKFARAAQPRPVEVDLHLFESGEPGSESLDCVIRLNAEGQSIADYLASIEGDFSPLSAASGPLTLLISSCDYHDRMPYPSEWPYPREQIKRGVNFACDATLSEEAASHLQDLLGQNPFGRGQSLSALVCEREVARDRPHPELAHEPYVRLRRVSGEGSAQIEIGGFKATLEHCDLWIPLAPDTEADLEVHLGGALGIGDWLLEVSAVLDLRYEVVTARVLNPLTLGELFGRVLGPSSPGQELTDEASGLAQLRDLLKGNILNVHLSEAWIVLPWQRSGTEDAVLAIGVSLTTGESIKLIKDSFSFKPVVEVQIHHPFSSTRRALTGTVSGLFTLAEGVELEGKLVLPDWSFTATAEVPSVQGLLQPLGLDIATLPEALRTTSVAVAVSADLVGDSKSFSARLEVKEKDAAWKGTLGQLEWELGSVVIEVDYDNAGSGGKPACWLNGRFAIGGCKFDVAGGYDGGWFVRGSTEDELDLSLFVERLFESVSLPAKIPKGLKLTDVALSAAFTGNEYSLSGRTAGAWELLGAPKDGAKHLSIEIEHFTISKSADGIGGEIIANLEIAETRVRLSGSKGDGWKFSGRAQGIPIGKLVGELIGAFDKDAEYPPVLDKFEIEDLEVDFDTKDTHFTLRCHGQFEIREGTTVDGLVTVEAQQGSVTLSGEFTIGDTTVKGDFRRKQSTDTFLGTYRPSPPGSSKRIQLEDLVGGIVPKATKVPSVSIGIKDFLFAYVGVKESTAFLAGVTIDLDAKLKLAELKPVGSLFGKQEIGLDGLRVLVASADLSADQVKTLNGVLPEGIEKLPELAADHDGGAVALGKGFHLAGELKLGNLEPAPLLLPASGAGELPAGGSLGAQGGPPKGAAPEPAGAKWIDIRRSLGPLYFGRVGVRYVEKTEGSDQGPGIGLLLDAAIDLAGLHVGLSGFQVRFPLRALDKQFRPTFALDGLELSYAGGPLQITGSFLKVPEKLPEQYEGMALIKAPNFAITGFGSYTTVGGDPSMFIFAILHAELGGPPFFRVQGLAAGFGYNRKLTLPPIEEVHEFPLVRAALEEDFVKKDSPGQSIQVVMGKLRSYVAPSSGDYWIAAGVRFSSFEMIQSVALLSVSFGHDVEIGLLGLSKMSVPKGATAGNQAAYAELALRVVIRPAEGTVAVEGRLTDASFILSRDCRLTGGFAFYLWWAGPHAGDFVVTLGGYHPAFPKRDHYPVVPRLGARWQVSSELTVTAELYFALTPSCLMAGGKLSAKYHSGSIRVWFVAYADFLLSWEPFYYSVESWILIGVEADLELLSLRAELSAALLLSGPPFSGKIYVDLEVISFTVRFGELGTARKPLSAKEFEEAFLPGARSEVLVTQIHSGLIRQEDGERKEPLRVVNAHALALSVRSLIPVTKFDGLAPQDSSVTKKEPSVGVRPMGKPALASNLLVSVRRDGVDFTGGNLRVSRVEDHAPEALWGTVGTEGVVPPPVAEARTVPATVGLRFSFAPIDPMGALPPMDIEKFAYDTFEIRLPWDPKLRASSPLTAQERGGKGIQTMMSEVMSGEIAGRRNAVLAVLRRQSPHLNDVKLDALVQTRDSYFQADPQACRLGSRNEGILAV